jgi:hypothetical protein
MALIILLSRVRFDCNHEPKTKVKTPKGLQYNSLIRSRLYVVGEDLPSGPPRCNPHPGSGQ